MHKIRALFCLLTRRYNASHAVSPPSYVSTKKLREQFSKCFPFYFVGGVSLLSNPPKVAAATSSFATTSPAPMCKHKRRMRGVRHTPSRLTLHSFTLADLRRETGLDSRDGPPRATAVAGNKVETVFALVELGVWGATSLASHVFHCKSLLTRMLPVN